jgi:hypothetical protein
VSAQLPKPALDTTGIEMPADFPRAGYERVMKKVKPLAGPYAQMYDHFGGAWNAISYRYMAMCFHGDNFSTSIVLPQGEAAAYYVKRYEEERELFGFFSNCFSTFESFFYGMYAVGNFLDPGTPASAGTPAVQTNFPMTAKDLQFVTPSSTDKAYKKAFHGDAFLGTLTGVFADVRFRELREIRNILTHRTAPGRRMFVGIGSDEELPDVWKLNDIPLDAKLTPARRANTAQLLATLLDAAADFVEQRVK